MSNMNLPIIFRSGDYTKLCREISSLGRKAFARGVQLRFTTNLYPLREAVLNKDFKIFGIHRFNHARKL